MQGISDGDKQPSPHAAWGPTDGADLEERLTWEERARVKSETDGRACCAQWSAGAVPRATGPCHIGHFLNLSAHVREHDRLVADFGRKLAENLVGERWGHGENSVEIERDHLTSPHQPNDLGADFLAKNPAAEDLSMFFS